MAEPFAAAGSATTLENIVRILADATGSAFFATGNLFTVREIMKAGWSQRLAASAAIAASGENMELKELWGDPEFLCDVVKVEALVCKKGGLLPMVNTLLAFFIPMFPSKTCNTTMFNWLRI